MAQAALALSRVRREGQRHAACDAHPVKAAMANSEGGAGAESENFWLETTWAEREQEYLRQDAELSALRQSRMQARQAATSNSFIRALSVSTGIDQEDPVPVSQQAGGTSLLKRSANALQKQQKQGRTKSPGRTRQGSPAVTRRSPASKDRGAMAKIAAVQALGGADTKHAFLAEAMDRIFEGLGSRAEAAMAFRRMDKDGSGELDQYEFKMALKVMRLHLSDEQAAVVVNELDKDGDGLVSIEEFLQLVWQGKLERVRHKFRAVSYSMGKRDFRKLFRHYDRDNSGELDFEEFRRAVRKDAKITADVVSDEELLEMFESVDTDGGGSIGVDEFCELLGAGAPSGALARYASVSGQVLQKILEHADEKKTNLLYLFHRYDKDSSGGLDPEEFRDAMREIGLELSRADMKQLMAEIDTDGDGYISIGEFNDRMRRAKRDGREVLKTVSGALQLQSLWRIPTAAVS